MLKKIDIVELLVVGLSLFFAIGISLYHLSYDGYKGLSSMQWDAFWAVFENGFSLLMCWMISVSWSSVVSKMFKYVFVPYFLIKLIYHISCYAKIFIMSVEKWEFIWSLICVFLLVIGFLYCIILIRRM